jgi:Protein of unknown function (DUF1566)
VRGFRIRAALAATALAAMVSLARADAPSGQYQLFNSSDTTIWDTKTNLVWERRPPSGPAGQYSFQNAATRCQGLSLNGFGNWRVPSYKELLTLVDEHPHDEYENGGLVPHAIDGNAFPQTAVDQPYWTSSMYPEDHNQNSAYSVDFGNGGQAYQTSLSQPLYVRCVH